MLDYLSGYPEDIREEARELLARGELLEMVLRRHPERHDVRTDRALYDYVSALKARHMKNAPPLTKVCYVPRLHVLENALGLHSTLSRAHGGRLRARREIRVASLFKDAPASFLRMIVVHELAHMKERDHDQAFYALCTRMEPDYHQLELDVRLWLTAVEAAPKTGSPDPA